MKPRSVVGIVAMVVCGVVCLLLAFAIHLALLASGGFNWVGR